MLIMDMQYLVIVSMCLKLNFFLARLLTAQNMKIPADLVAFTKEVLDEKLRFSYNQDHLIAALLTHFLSMFSFCIL